MNIIQFKFKFKKRKKLNWFSFRKINTFETWSEI